jgi:hypothetical protein
MLERLDDVPWSTLNHAYGSAADIPQLLRDLTQQDAELREAAWNSLYSNLWHQGSLYEATAFAVPFLIGLVSIRVDAAISIVGGLQRIAVRTLPIPAPGF